MFQWMSQEATKVGVKKEDRVGGIIFDEMSIQKDLSIVNQGCSTYYTGLTNISPYCDMLVKLRKKGISHFLYSHMTHYILYQPAYMYMQIPPWDIIFVSIHVPFNLYCLQVTNSNLPVMCYSLSMLHIVDFASHWHILQHARGRHQNLVCCSGSVSTDCRNINLK